MITKYKIKNKKEYERTNWLCDSCESKIDSNSHVIWCEAYRELREGKDLHSDKDLAEYLKKVMSIREKLNLTR